MNTAGCLYRKLNTNSGKSNNITNINSNNTSNNNGNGSV